MIDLLSDAGNIISWFLFGWYIYLYGKGMHLIVILILQPWCLQIVYIFMVQNSKSKCCIVALICKTLILPFKNFSILKYKLNNAIFKMR